MIKINIKQILFTVVLSIVAVFAYTNVAEASNVFSDCFHTYTAATCTTPKTCTKCGKTLEAPLGHKYEVCGNTAKCSRCGVSKIIGGNTSEETEKPVEPSNPVHTHTYTAATCTTPKTCTSCGVTTGNVLGHNYTTQIISSTCTENGSKIVKCTRCGINQTTVIAATGHDYTTKTTSATCTVAGKTVKTCENCGDTQTTTVAALGHDYKTTTTNATCTTAGKVVKTCSRCNDTKITTVAALGHDYKTTTTSATCTTAGKAVKTCSRCKDTITTTIAALGHDYKITTTNATCTTPGTTVKKCSVCGITVTTTGEALGHRYAETSRIEATCIANGKIVKVCKNCNDKQELTVPALGHKTSIVFNETHHWYECDRCSVATSAQEKHIFNDDNVCTECGYKKNGEKPEEPDEPSYDEDNDELIIEPWMKENDKLNVLAVSLRSEPYEEERANKNIYALGEKIIYYVDYKNGGKDTNKEVTLQLNLPLSFSVVDADGASVSTSKKTLTWKFDGMENDESGTKTVIIKYKSLGKSSLTYKTITPKATISLAKSEKDVSAVLNLIVKDFDEEVNDEHEPYMYGDKDTKTFRPDATITRAEGALVLTRIFGISTIYDSNTYAFPDLNETYLEARKAVIAATKYGLIQGYPDGTYKPNKSMTRGEFITILARQIEEEYGEGFEVKDEESLIKVYKDKTRIYYISENEYYDAHWSIAYATLLARLNMTPLTEDSTNLRVDAPITRAEVAQLVNLYLLRAPAEVSSSTKVSFPDVSKRHELFADIVEATRKAHTYSITEDGTEEDE